MKKVIDSIWGKVYLTPLQQKFINTYEFQRLRNIKQCGSSYYIFPSASGNRFEHSIGTGHIAGEIAKVLQRKYPEKVSDNFIELISVAGNLHDIGHGPFSHLFDKFLEDHDTPNKYHEKRSKEIIKYIIDKYKIGLSENDYRFICDTFKEGKTWEYQIISNSSFDADRIDYVFRDTHNFGIYNPITKECIKNIIIENVYIENDKLMYDDYNSDFFCNFKNELYKDIYKHEKSVKIDNLILKVFKRANKLYNLKRSVDNIENFLKLDDSILFKVYHDPRMSLMTKKLIEKIFKIN
jgi:deoxynucleoside triphosphate triphosphohydrolase SAMHD1